MDRGRPRRKLLGGFQEQQNGKGRRKPKRKLKDLQRMLYPV
jgi:hypothetical protein